MISYKNKCNIFLYLFILNCFCGMLYIDAVSFALML